MTETRGVSATRPVDGKLTVTINVHDYGVTGIHWRDQLSGSNRKKWGRIFVDTDKQYKKLNRLIATGHARGLFKGQAVDIDECPGAMFMWDGPEQQAHDTSVDRESNQALGRDLYNALRSAIDGPMQWYEVDFQFVG